MRVHAGGMIVHKVTVKGKRGISWIERKGQEVVLIFRGGRVDNIMQKKKKKQL